MKTLKSVLVVGFALTSIGCAKYKSPNATGSKSGTNSVPVVNIPSTPFVPSGSGPGSGPGSNWEYGGQAPLTVTSLSTMSDYTGRPMNAPTDIKINLNLKKFAANSFGGVVSIAYREEGKNYEGNFTSGTTAEHNKYNVRFVKSGQTVYHGFFEDYMGGLIVVLDSVIDLGDGGPVDDLVGGSVWYKNFGLTYAPNPMNGYLPGFGRPNTYCWFISLGPYDCRAWKKDRVVETTRAIHPDNGYVKLGTFSGMSIEEAFNGEY